jgi:tetratricopeptide (TPR) repeat protein
MVEGYKLARATLEKALDLNPQIGRAWAALGDLEIHDTWDFTTADHHMQRALALNPGDTYVLRQVAHIEYLFGRTDAAIDMHRKIVVLDPVSPGAHIRLGRMYFRANRLEEAADSIRLGMSLTPPDRRGVLQHILGQVLLAQGDAPAALVAMEQETRDWVREFGLAIVQHALGHAGAADATLDEFIEKYTGGAEFQVALIYAYRNENDLAFDWLDKAYDNRDVGLPLMLLNPLLANLHDDPRWNIFLDKMGLPH